MAQTKRKRRTKHRGTAAGSIEARGRTGRPPTADERKKQSRTEARERRMNTPPTWKRSIIMAVFASLMIFVLISLTAKGHNKIVPAAIFALIAMVIYAPAGYYLELFAYRRRQRRKALGK